MGILKVYSLCWLLLLTIYAIYDCIKSGDITLLIQMLIVIVPIIIYLILN